MKELEMFESPFEIFELENGQEYPLRILKWKLGKSVIKTAEVPGGKEIKCLRCFVPKDLKPIGPDWWDITSQTLIAQLLPYFEGPNFKDYKYIIKKYGVKPKARFTVQVIPV